jgi:uncharacterized protein YxjI
MKLLLKKKLFFLTDTYDICDEYGDVKYQIRAEFLSPGCQLHIYDAHRKEIGSIRQKTMSLLPVFEIEMNGLPRGQIEKKLSFWKSKYEMAGNGWRAEGNRNGKHYEVYSGCNSAAQISREYDHRDEVYVTDIKNPKDELAGLWFLLSIDAENLFRNVRYQ